MTAKPFPVVLRFRLIRIVFTVVEDHLEQPVGSLGQVFVRFARSAVAVFDALEVAVRRAALIGSVLLVRLRQIDVRRILTLILVYILVEDRISLVVVALADQPAKHARLIGRVGDPAICRLAVECGDVVPGDRAPMHIAVAPACPAFDAGEQPLDARAVATNGIVLGPDLAGNDVALPLSVNFFERRNQVFGAGQDEDVRLVGVPVLGQPLVRLTGDGGDGQVPA